MCNTIYPEVREEAVEKVISKILLFSKKRFSEKALRDLRITLMRREVEKGVSVYMTSNKPNRWSCYLIGKIDMGTEYLYLWWDDNINKNKIENPNLYSLGLNFRYKKSFYS